MNRNDTVARHDSIAVAAAARNGVDVINPAGGYLRELQRQRQGGRRGQRTPTGPILLGASLAAVPKTGSATSIEIAAQAGLDATLVHRSLQALARMNFVSIDVVGNVSLTDDGRSALQR